MKPYQDINKETIDRWVEAGWEWGKPVSHEEYLNAKKGEWKVILTPTVAVPHEWIGEIRGKRILGLASGGGQQIPIFTALGAECTVLDYSSKQIESELLVAAREGYKINAIEADMTNALPFEDEVFDIVFHPVSNCYVEDVYHVFNEAYRVLKKGGLFLAGLNNEINYIVDNEEKEIVWKMPFNPLKDEKQREYMENEKAGMQFSHNQIEKGC
jgi:ubiquinone/menaquinone biosynthesis C-methylase UbiE